MSLQIYQRKVEGSKMNLIRIDSKLKGVNLTQYAKYYAEVDKKW